MWPLSYTVYLDKLTNNYYLVSSAVIRSGLCGMHILRSVIYMVLIGCLIRGMVDSSSKHILLICVANIFLSFTFLFVCDCYYLLIHNIISLLLCLQDTVFGVSLKSLLFRIGMDKTLLYMNLPQALLVAGSTLIRFDWVTVLKISNVPNMLELTIWVLKGNPNLII